MEQVFDVAIIGGGINGCGCAADAALRGLSVVLCEQGDLASKTSSKSSKLIHGGLRYLEQFNFSLVKKALNERQKLLTLAPHLVHPLPFVIPYQKSMRPLWMLRTGLFLYDHLSFANKLPRTKLIRRRQQPTYFDPLNNNIEEGFLYYDCATDDARLTLINAMQAKEHGASIMPYTSLIQAEVINGLWQLTVQDKAGHSSLIRAKAVINTAGPWIASVNELLSIPLEHTLSLVKGSHIVVPKLYDGEHAYLLQHQDKRIVFSIPYQGYTMIGTTDIAFSGNIDDINIEASEIDYLCTLINQYFNKKIYKNDIITTWSGIRPLLCDSNKTPSALSRDYIYHYTNQPAPAVTVYGGKITTYRQLALQVINLLRTVFPHLKDSKTEYTLLPGASMNTMSFSSYVPHAYKKYDWLEKETLMRLLNTYGTRTEHILSNCNNMSNLGKCFTHTLYQIEIDYLIREEWADNCDDILWRRTKIGMTISDEEKKNLEHYLN